MQSRSEGARIEFGMGEHIGREFTEAAPDQFLLESLLLGGAHGRQDGESPAARPGPIRCAVNTPGRFGEAFAAIARQVVLAELAAAPSLEPSVLGETCGRGPHPPSVEAES